MDPTSNDHHQNLEQVESIDDLLEDFWFFENLLDRRSRILRYCHSDPYPSTSSSSSSATYPKPESPKTGDSDLENKLVEASTVAESVPPPPSPPCIEIKEAGVKPEKKYKMRRQFSEKIRVQEQSTYLHNKERVVREKGIRDSSRKNRTSTSGCNNSVKCIPMGGSLQRTQTLPSYLGREDDDRNEFQEQERDDSRMGFLIREAIASSSSEFITPKKQNIPKVSSIPRHRPPRNSRSEEAIQELVAKTQIIPNRKTLRKTLSSIDTKEIMVLTELDIQEKEEERRVPRTAANRPGVVVGQPVPVWVPNDSRRDMKAQIKFWARTVASNIRQEC
ncbi:unnamed protein product [Cochlearia groenlandica]